MRLSSDKQVGILTYQRTNVNRKVAEKVFFCHKNAIYAIGKARRIFDRINRKDSDFIATEHAPVPALPWPSQVQAEASEQKSKGKSKKNLRKPWFLEPGV
jgi:hypothetical protein